MERLRLPAKLSSLDRFREFVNRSAGAAGIGPSLLARIQIVLEELLVNHERHAYCSGEGHSEVVCFRRAPGMFCLEVMDEGRPFNPLDRAPPDVTLGAEERPVGGLGIHLVRSLADKIAYRREGGNNVVCACFAICSEGIDDGKPEQNVADERGP